MYFSMSDEEESPRSSRSARKRSSALTKLAIKKRTGLGSEDGSEFGSRDSLGGITPRYLYTGSEAYLAAAVQ